MRCLWLQALAIYRTSAARYRHGTQCRRTELSQGNTSLRHFTDRSNTADGGHVQATEHLQLPTQHLQTDALGQDTGVLSLSQRLAVAIHDYCQMLPLQLITCGVQAAATFCQARYRHCWG